MTISAPADTTSRSPEALRHIFEYWGEVECPQLDGHLYRAACRGIIDDPDLLAIASLAPATQPPPNLLFAAVHDLLLAGAAHPLRRWYPLLAQGDPEPADTVFGPFRNFCLANRVAIEERVATRLTQTNVVQRCTALLPAFAEAFAAGGGAPLSLVEIGSSAGLNLQWNRFRYEYDDGTGWGDPESPVHVEAEMRGAPLPALPDRIGVAWRCGIDLHPIDLEDADEQRWLRALVWPDHPGRQQRLDGAIELARLDPPVIHRGDAAERLPDLLAEAPADTTLCVYGTHTLYQFPRQALIRTLKAMQESAREVHFIGMEGSGDRSSELFYTQYRNGERSLRKLARCNPHGRWLEWGG